MAEGRIRKMNFREFLVWFKVSEVSKSYEILKYKRLYAFTFIEKICYFQYYVWCSSIVISNF